MAGGPHPALSRGDLSAIWRRLRFRVVAVGVGYIAMGTGLFLIVVPRPEGVGMTGLIVQMLIAVSVISTAVIYIAIGSVGRDYMRSTRWIRHATTPSEAELRRTSDLAVRSARAVLISGATIVTSFVTIGWYLHRWLNVWRVEAGATVTVGGATLLTFLVAERTLGPILALTIEYRRPRVGVLGRLVLVWAQAAATPFAALIFAPQRIGLDAVRWIVLGTGLAISLVGFLVTGRSVADPLQRLRRAVESVRAGDLDVQVRADDGGEIGKLQRAFNEMVSAMRERDRLATLFGRYVGASVAEHALAGNDQLGGEIRTISALFVDIESSTALAQVLPPDELVVMLNGFYGVVVEVVAAEGGFVNKFEGDAALAIFGAPKEQPDHADRALRAARALRERLAALAIVFPMLDAGIGLCTGDAVAGNVGAADRYEFTVIGDPVNVASRLSDMAQEHPGRLLVAESTIISAKIEARNWVIDGIAQVAGREGDMTLYVPASSSARASAGVVQPYA